MPLKITKQKEQTRIETWQRRQFFSLAISLMFLTGWNYTGIEILKEGVKPNMTILGSSIFGYLIIFAIIITGTLFVLLVLISIFYREALILKNKEILIEIYWGPFKTSYRQVPLKEVININVESYPVGRGLVRYKILFNCHLKKIRFGIGLSRIDADNILNGPLATINRLHPSG